MEALLLCFLSNAEKYLFSFFSELETHQSCKVLSVRTWVKVQALQTASVPTLTETLMCFKSRSKYCNPNQSLPQTKMQKSYCYFFHNRTCTLLACPSISSKRVLGGWGVDFKANSASLTVECLEVGQALAAQFSRWSTLSNSRLSSHSFFPGKLGRLMTSIRRARTDVAPPRAHQPQPGLTTGVTPVQPGAPPARRDHRAGQSKNHTAPSLTYPRPGTQYISSRKEKSFSFLCFCFVCLF